MTRYTPILKGKAAEYAALGHLSTHDPSKIFPLVEVVPGSSDSDPTEIERACRETARKLASSWRGDVAIDTTYLDGVVPTTAGLAIEVVADQARADGLSAVPVVHLSDDPAILAAARNVVALDARGIVVRVQDEDLAEDASVLDASFASLYRACGVSPSDVDVVLDIGAVGDNASLLTRVARDFLLNWKDVSSWRSLSLSSGAFPLTLDAIPPYGTGTIPRADAGLWSGVVSRTLPRIPDYGDYAIQHPMLPGTSGFGPAPQIRYAIDDDWLIHKGKKTDRRGHKQFYDICAKVIASRWYPGAAFSWADGHIQSAANSASGTELVGTGNATTWRTIGTVRHVELVLSRLATLGAP